MNRLKKIFSILLMVVFLVNTFLGSTSKNAFADGTLKTQLRIINLNGDGTIDGKFTSNVSYDKSVDVFDFGKKNSSSVINYVLQINIKESLLQNNFQTVSISESEFRK